MTHSTIKLFYLSERVQLAFVWLSHLFEFVQFGDVCYAGQAHIDEAEQLQIRELCCDSFDLPFAGATVIQNQLLDLRGGGDSPVWVKRQGLKSATCTDNHIYTGKLAPDWLLVNEICTFLVENKSGYPPFLSRFEAAVEIFLSSVGTYSVTTQRPVSK